MRLLRLGIPALLLCGQLFATLIPGPNLAKRIETADSIVVGKVVRGTIRTSGGQVSNDLVLHIDRVLKGGLIPATDIDAHLEGRGVFMVPTPSESAIPQQIYGIWFLNSASHPYIVISRDGQIGELYMAPVVMPEGAPAGRPGATPAASVANEMVSAMSWLGAPGSSSSDKKVAAENLSKLRSLSEDFRSLERAVTLPAYRQFVLEKSLPLRAIGIQGLISADDPEGVTRAAAEWTELSSAAAVFPISSSLMSYSNTDPGGVRALAALALREDPEPSLRQNAVYALRAIHTKEALPALIALLDDQSERVRPYALSGLCLFVRNGPAVTPQSVPSMSWLQSRQPAPFLTPEAERYCSLGGTIDSTKVDAYVSFWKSWWSEHRAEIESH
ncbi:MAG TPA: HEAT repeat domain-containing protein [Bryobacteraceae bacterium]